MNIQNVLGQPIFKGDDQCQVKVKVQKVIISFILYLDTFK